MLESYLEQRRSKGGRKICLMTHIVIGYPSLEESYRTVEAMVAAGVDLMELQIPFSEPTADGPVIQRANQRALAAGIRVSTCLDFAQRVADAFEIPFLFMSYYNILFKYGVERFAARMAQAGIRGAIVPDLPPEEGQAYLAAMASHALAPIFIFSPTTSDSRMDYLADFARGFVYCVARKGVTGLETSFSAQLKDYLKRCRRATQLPLALGFGVKEKADIDFLIGKVDIAVIGTQTIRLLEANGVTAVRDFIAGLR
jgi:tryptophan synthase alpha chain